MDSLVIYLLKHIIAKEKSGNGFPFPYKPSFMIFVSEHEVTLIWFSLFIGKIYSFFRPSKGFFCGWELMDMNDLCGERTPGFQKYHRGLCMLLLLGSNPMFCFAILAPSGSGKTGLLEGTLSPPVSFIIQGGGAFCSFAALGLIFPCHKNRSLGVFYEGQF